ncbi:MAG: hypothetical protein R3C59_12180 [Planctomycetaceae bacterium]
MPLQQFSQKTEKCKQPADFAAFRHGPESAESAETCAELIEMGAPTVYLCSKVSAEL